MRCARWVARSLVFSRMETTPISGTQRKSRAVSPRLYRLRMRKLATILTAAMKNSSGQWWANSVTSNRSLVIRPMIWPILLLA